jgi:hypothetical protein
MKRSARRRESLLRVAEERERRRVHRLRQKRKGAARAGKVPKPLDIWPKRSSFLRESHRANILVPKIFSFIDNPIETTETLDRLRDAADNKFVRQIHIDHSRCEKLDLCASVVMDVLILRAQGQRRKAHGLLLSGTLSGRADVDTMVRASGILKQIGHPASTLVDQEKVIVCDLFQGSPGDPRRSTKGEIAATRLTEYFDRCLCQENYTLNSRGKNYISSLISEVIANAEEHSNRGRGKLWYTIAHYNRLPDERGGECHIVLFNFGDSIYESFQREETSQTFREEIGALAETHRKRGFLGIGGSRWNEETLWTLYALQEGVSRLRGTPGGEDRGNGTIEMIQFFSSLATESRAMVVVSGSAYVLFDGTYGLRSEPIGHETRKIIAFNSDNSLELPPDGRFVRSLPLAFPGTLVSMRFVLSEAHLKEFEGVQR